MGLKIWLPMTHATKNDEWFGPRFTQGGATIVDGGKTGEKCWQYNGTSACSYYHSNFTIDCSHLSICCWVYETARPSQYGNIFALNKSGGFGNSSLAVCDCSSSVSNTTNQNKLIFAVANTSTTEHLVKVDNATYLPLNTWVHIAATFDGQTLTGYVNGVPVGTAAFSGNIFTGFNLAFGGRSRADNRSMFTNFFKGKINDFRVYDHCLSAAEVHEISQGLVLHYKLDGYQGGITNPNLISSLDTSFLSYADGAFSTFTNQMNGGTKEIVSNIAGAKKCMHLHSNGGSDRVYGFLQNMPAGKAYTISCDYYGTVTRNSALRGEMNGGNYSWAGVSSESGNYTTANQWVRLKVSTPVLTSSTTLYYFFYCSNGYDCYIKNIKIEEGTSATPWCPADTQTPVNRTVVPDSSGYDHHGTVIGTPTFNGNTARYSVSTYLDTGVNTRIVTPSITFEPHAVTMSIWFRSTSTSPTGNYHMVVDSNANRQWYEMAVSSSGFFRCGLFVNGTRYAKNGTSTNILNGNWHMLTVTYDGSIIKRYVDGIMEADSSITYSTGLSSPTALTIGRDGPSASYAVAAAYLSDFRVYCTALSANDVKQLYNMGAKVDNKGNLHAYEFNENGSNKLKKTGIFYNYAIEPYKKLPDGSCWKLMLFHYVDGGRNLFTSSNATYNDGFGLYSRLRDINNFKYNNKYEFYVLQDDKEFRWTQTSQPTASSISGLTTVSGYTNPVNGLAKASQSNTYIGYNAWWGACGCWASFSTGGKTGIPGFGSHDGNGICTTYLALYTRIDTITYRNASNSHYANNLIEI